MPLITVVEFDGTHHCMAAEVGKSLMQNIVEHGIPGVDADCGGACACGTCHCFIEAGWLEVAGSPDFMEEGMLKTRPDRASNSRLACQIDVHEALDGLVIHLPEYQM